MWRAVLNAEAGHMVSTIMDRYNLFYTFLDMFNIIKETGEEVTKFMLPTEFTRYLGIITIKCLSLVYTKLGRSD